MDRARALRASPLLHDFTDVGVRVLAEAVEERSLARGSTLFHAGEPGDCLYFLASGALTVAQEGAALGELRAGEALGGVSLLEGGTHLASVSAAADSDLLVLTRDRFAGVQRDHPRTALKLVLALAQDLARRMSDARGPLGEFLAWQAARRSS